jgi:methionyl-tRNA formyltransferase
VAERARQLGLPLVQTANASAEPTPADAGVVVAFGQILREPLLSAYPLFNLHPSALPRWRGAAPIERAIMAGDTDTAACVIGVTAALDAGPIHAETRFAIGPEDDAGALYARSIELGTPLLLAALRGEGRARPQPREGVTYAAKITAADRELDWSRPARDLALVVRALSPHIGARAELDGRPLIVWQAREQAAELRPGGVDASDRSLVVGCGEGALELLVVQPSGRRRMSAAELLRGLREAPRWAT